MVSTMPKTLYDSLKLVSMVDLPFYHVHVIGDISNIVGKVSNIQVQFRNRDTVVGFIILESTNEGNIVLGRTFLKAMRCFIDVGKGQIRFRGKAKGAYVFPRRKKEEPIEEPFSNFDDPYDDSFYAT